MAVNEKLPIRRTLTDIDLPFPTLSAHNQLSNSAESRGNAACDSSANASSIIFENSRQVLSATRNADLSSRSLRARASQLNIAEESKVVVRLQDRRRDSHTHIFTAALLELLCSFYESRPKHRDAVYRRICAQLAQRDIVSPIVFDSVYANLRKEYLLGFNELVKATVALVGKNSHALQQPHSVAGDKLQQLIAYTKPQTIERLMRSTADPRNDFYSSRYADDFDEIKQIGKGGFGVVFEVKNKLDDMRYAVKKVRLKHLSVEKCRKILREVKLLANLNHVSVVRYNSAWLERDSAPDVRIRSLSEGDISSSSEDNGHFGAAIRGQDVFEGVRVMLHIQMELCKSNLHDWLDDRNTELFAHHSGNEVFHHVKEAENMNFIQQLLHGLNYIHSKGVIHRDIKTRNIFIDVRGALKIGDFGLAREDLATPSPTFTTTLIPAWHFSGVKVDDVLSRGVGTSVYAAPEQRSSIYDNKSDIFSAGIIAFELFCPCNTEAERYHMVDKLRVGIIPEELITLYKKQVTMILKMVEFDPANRPSAQEILNSELYVNQHQMIDHMEARIECLETHVEQLEDHVKSLMNDKAKLQQLSRISCDEYAEFLAWKKNRTL